MTTLVDYYGLLGVSRFASVSDIRRAYRSLALQLHPDKNPGGSQQFKSISEAYAVLADGPQRSTYDQKLFSSFYVTAQQQQQQQTRPAGFTWPPPPRPKTAATARPTSTGVVPPAEENHNQARSAGAARAAAQGGAEPPETPRNAFAADDEQRIQHDQQRVRQNKGEHVSGYTLSPEAIAQLEAIKRRHEAAMRFSWGEHSQPPAASSTHDPESPPVPPRHASASAASPLNQERCTTPHQMTQGAEKAQKAPNANRQAHDCAVRRRVQEDERANLSRKENEHREETTLTEMQRRQFIVELGRQDVQMIAATAARRPATKEDCTSEASVFPEQPAPPDQKVPVRARYSAAPPFVVHPGQAPRPFASRPTTAPATRSPGVTPLQPPTTPAQTEQLPVAECDTIVVPRDKDINTLDAVSLQRLVDALSHKLRVARQASLLTSLQQ